jgi:hypothetical protein
MVVTLPSGSNASAERARQLLADELGVPRGLEPNEAEAWIDAQLARTPA